MLEVESVDIRDIRRLEQEFEQTTKNHFSVPQNRKNQVIGIMSSIVFQQHIENKIIKKNSDLTNHLISLVHKFIYCQFSLTDFRGVLEHIGRVQKKLQLYEGYVMQLSQLLLGEHDLDDIFSETSTSFQQMKKTEKELQKYLSTYCHNEQNLSSSRMKSEGSYNGCHNLSDKQSYLINCRPWSLSPLTIVDGQDLEYCDDMKPKRNSLREEMPASPKFFQSLCNENYFNPGYEKTDDQQERISNQNQSDNEITYSTPYEYKKIDDISSHSTLCHSKFVNCFNQDDLKRDVGKNDNGQYNPKPGSPDLNSIIKPHPSFLSNQNIDELIDNESREDVKKCQLFKNSLKRTVEPKTTAELMYSKNLKMRKIKSKLSSRNSSFSNKSRKGSESSNPSGELPLNFIEKAGEIVKNSNRSQLLNKDFSGKKLLNSSITGNMYSKKTQNSIKKKRESITTHNNAGNTNIISNGPLFFSGNYCSTHPNH